jgi:hypothetical protein
VGAQPPVAVESAHGVGAGRRIKVGAGVMSAPAAMGEGEHVGAGRGTLRMAHIGRPLMTTAVKSVVQGSATDIG